MLLTVEGQDGARSQVADPGAHLVRVPLVPDRYATHVRLRHGSKEDTGDRNAHGAGRLLRELEGQTVRSCAHLDATAVGERAEVMRLEGDQATQTFLVTEGLRPGVAVKPLALGDGGAMLLEAGDKRLNLAKEITDQILINV